MTKLGNCWENSSINWWYSSAVINRHYSRPGILPVAIIRRNWESFLAHREKDFNKLYSTSWGIYSVFICMVHLVNMFVARIFESRKIFQFGFAEMYCLCTYLTVTNQRTCIKWFYYLNKVGNRKLTSLKLPPKIPLWNRQ